MTEAKKDVYDINYSDQLDINNIDEVTADLELNKSVEQVLGGVKGNVTTYDSQPVPDVTVKLFDLDYNPIVHTMTDENGNYLITNVDPGEYMIFAVKDGYDLTVPDYITIEDEIIIDDSITIYETSSDKLTAIYGIVTDENGVVANANVDLFSKDLLTYSTKTTDDGEYIMYGVAPGEYTILAYNDSCKSKESSVITLEEEIPLNQDIFIVDNNSNLKGTITGIITDKSTKQTLRNVFVALYKIVDGKETLIKTTLTEQKGRYFFGDVESGTYKVKSISNTEYIAE